MMKLDFSAPDERRVLADGRVVVDVLRVGCVPVLRVSHAPGWRWSLHSTSDAGPPCCPNIHVGVMVSGSMMVELAGAPATELVAGDAFAIPPGHDAWTVGNAPAVLIQFDEGHAAQSRYTPTQLAKES